MRHRAGQLSGVPDIVAGRRVRCIEVALPQGAPLLVLEAADPDAVLEEAVQQDGHPYAALLWPSAIAAAGVLHDIAGAGTRVFDVGAGTGVVALAAARRGTPVVFSETVVRVPREPHPARIGSAVLEPTTR
jgi:predicted nicotinamide N-methyase